MAGQTRSTMRSRSVIGVTARRGTTTRSTQSGPLRSPAAVARRIRPIDETDELRRRMGWLGPDVPMELVMEHMTAELDALRRR
jgi:hypothetical protein